MTDKELYKLKYPIGEFSKPSRIESSHIKTWIQIIELFPNEIKSMTKHLTEDELNYKYRPNGWTIKQVVHHCADSHINSLLRFKLALTEDTPTIKPYYEDRFANLIDYSQPIETAVSILQGVHKKLGLLLNNLNANDLKKEFVHPEHNKHFSLEETIGVYAWHSEHHLAHIQQAIDHKGRFN
ncbi:YfiT family bacillithiol transferase [uncultured Winogradskyella sp.]|uniref:YfiT family bacillithiol transferase n=1 Tax=uncultured Winogradskyella sp. TaxID=395353 RepID=UPI002616E047|nr:putative metal-dependent hydrolase [uncultured Winogradskyella sp.]